MNIEKEKDELKLSLEDLRVEAKHLISNIDVALSHIDEVTNEEEARKFSETYDIEHGLSHIRLF